MLIFSQHHWKKIPGILKKFRLKNFSLKIFSSRKNRKFFDRKFFHLGKKIIGKIFPLILLIKIFIISEFFSPKIFSRKNFSSKIFSIEIFPEYRFFYKIFSENVSPIFSHTPLTTLTKRRCVGEIHCISRTKRSWANLWLFWNVQLRFQEDCKWF